MEIRHALTFISLLVFISEKVEALKCYQCDSTLDHNCQEFFNHNNPNIPLRATECQMYSAKYCIKATGIWGGIVGTHRFCSSRDLGDQCQDMRFPDHSRKYRGCVFTCSSDGCNSAPSVLPSSASVVVLGLVTYLITLVWRT